MATTLGSVITAVRLKHPDYSADLITNRVLAEAFTSLQRRLVLKATQLRPQFLSQHFAVTFAFDAANLPGTVGAGTSGGLPAAVDGSGVLEPSEATIGIAPVFDFTDVVELASERVITVVTDNGNGTTTLTFQGSPGWTVNGFIGDYVQIVDGPGQGAASLRAIISNTANTLTVLNYATVPVANQSVGRVVSTPETSSEQLGVATALPAYGTTTGYLVKLDSSGQPYLDLTTPIQTQFEQGIPLPPLNKLLGANVLWSGVTQSSDFTSNVIPLGLASGECVITGYQQRNHPPGFPAVYMLGNELFLCGTMADWMGSAGLDIRYSPIPPAFGTTATTLEELFLLPDNAFDCLVAHGGVVAARYASARGVNVDVVDAVQEAQVAEATWLRTIGQMSGSERQVARRNR